MASPAVVEDEDDPRATAVQYVINAASDHNVELLRRLIDTEVFDDYRAVDVHQFPTGQTPLHAAILSSSPDEDLDGPSAETVRLLLENGAIWNQLDHEGNTPGCIAYQSGRTWLYELMVDAGVRAEILLNRLDEYDILDDGEDDDDDNTNGQDPEAADKPGIVVSDTSEDPVATKADANTPNGFPESEGPKPDGREQQDVSSEAYLSSTLSMNSSELLDEQKNGVMMSWEKGIMAQSADVVLSSPGLRFLNIGFGMGIIDSLVQSHENRPVDHHIVEAHPDVLTRIRNEGWHEKAGIVIHAGKWQDVLPELAAQGLVFDAIFYDTFAESYTDFKEFFSEHLLGLLESTGKWSYFNGMGADRQISYDVYQKIVEMDLLEAGYDVEWTDVELPDLGAEWEGVRRKYWNVDQYRLPVCRFLD